MGRLSRIVTLDKINLAPVDAKDSNGILTLTANANTYKALAQSEVAAASAVSQAE